MPRYTSILLPAVAAVLAACAPTPVHAGTPPAELVTLLDYFEEGLAGTDRWIDGHRRSTGRDWHPVLLQVRDACVRVAVESRGLDGRRRAVIGSGVIVDGGLRVLTAGHSFQGVPVDSTIRITLRDGRSLAALPSRIVHEVGAGPTRDWAVLHLVDPPPGLPYASPAHAVEGEAVFVLGYPDRVGLDERGRVTHGFSREQRALDPIPFVARVSSASRMELEPIAGAVPIAGASGAPVFAENGSLLGVLVSVGRLAYPDGLRHVYEVAPVTAVSAPPPAAAAAVARGAHFASGFPTAGVPAR